MYRAWNHKTDVVLEAESFKTVYRWAVNEAMENCATVGDTFVDIFTDDTEHPKYRLKNESWHGDYYYTTIYGAVTLLYNQAEEHAVRRFTVAD